jgi:hypothetical protein
MPRRQRVNPRGPSMKRFGVTEVRNCRIAINHRRMPLGTSVQDYDRADEDDGRSSNRETSSIRRSVLKGLCTNAW